MFKTKVIAHRGFSGSYPENTMLAYEKAVEAGSDGIEMDIHLSRDGQVVIMHDADLSRTTNGSGLIQNYTVAQLKELDASAEFTGKYGRVQIPTLEEYFDYIRSTDVVTNIEVKSEPGNFLEIEQKAVALVRRYRLEERIIFSSFNHYSMVLCKKLAPEIACGLLYGSAIAHPGSYARSFGVEYMHPAYTELTPELVTDMKDSGVGINAWTINEEPDIRRFWELGIDGIITNFPDRARRIVDAIG